MLTEKDLEYYDRYRDLLKSEHAYTSAHINYGLLINGAMLAVYFQSKEPSCALPWIGCALTAVNLVGWFAAYRAARFFTSEWVRYMESRGVTRHTADSLMPEYEPGVPSVFPPFDSPRRWQLLGSLPGGVMQLFFLVYWIVLNLYPS